VKYEASRAIVECPTHTHTAAADEDDDECLEPARGADHPHHANEQNHSEDVLNAREVDAKHRTEFLTTRQRFTRPAQHSPQLLSDYIRPRNI